jgi:hypothetical protein
LDRTRTARGELRDEHFRKRLVGASVVDRRLACWELFQALSGGRGPRSWPPTAGANIS